MTRHALLALPLLLAACAATPGPGTPRPVESVDLARYAGTWHEAARFPQRFQDNARLRCTATTATYGARPDGGISVLNACTNALTGERREAQGVAYAVEGANNARLRVSFFRPFYADYWVVGLDPAYRWAVVGNADRSSLWILSREARMPEAEFQAALAAARREGFDLSRLQRDPG